MIKQSLEKEIFEQGPVLDAKGRPIPGFSRRSTLVYKRSAIKAPPWRIKEWDFYQVTNDHLCLQMTIGHAAYAGQVSLMLFDFVKGEKYIDASLILPLVFGRLHMPENAEKDNLLVYEKNGVTMRFETRDQKRVPGPEACPDLPLEECPGREGSGGAHSSGAEESGFHRDQSAV